MDIWQLTSTQEIVIIIAVIGRIRRVSFQVFTRDKLLPEIIAHCDVDTCIIHCQFENVLIRDHSRIQERNFINESSSNSLHPNHCIIFESPQLSIIATPVLPLKVRTMDELIIGFQRLSIREMRVPRSPAVNIDRLPAEILANVFQHLSNDDIFNLPHAICAKGLFDTEGRHRFRQHHIWIERQSLQNLARVSRHPVVRKYVKELVLCYQMPRDITLKRFLEYWAIQHAKPYKTPEDLTLDNFHALIGVPENHCTFCSAWPSLSQRWIAHKSTLKDLENLQKSREDVEMLVEAFRRFENFDAIVFDNSCRGVQERRFFRVGYFHHTEDDKTWSTFDRSFSLQLDSTPIDALIKALSISRSKPRSFRIMNNATCWWYKDEMYSASLYIEHLYRAEFFSGFSSFAICDAFCNMRQLELRGLIFFKNRESDWSTNRRESDLPLGEAEDASLTRSDQVMICIIRSAIWLEELTIHLTDLRIEGTTYGLPQIPLSTYPGPNQLCQMKRLDLAHFSVRPKHLITFLKLVAKSLTHLTLGDILLNGNWESVFDDIKGVFQLQCLRLYSLKIREPHGLRTPPFGEPCETPHQVGGDDEALAWLCGRSKVNPFRRIRWST